VTMQPGQHAEANTACARLAAIVESSHDAIIRPEGARWLPGTFSPW